MAMVVGKGVQNGLAFGDKWVARKTQFKTIIVKLFLWSFEYSTVVYGFVEHPPGTILSIILRAKQLAVNSRLYSFDLLIDNITVLSQNMVLIISFYSLHTLFYHTAYLHETCIVKYISIIWRNDSITFISRSHTAAIHEIYTLGRKEIYIEEKISTML